MILRSHNFIKTVIIMNQNNFKKIAESLIILTDFFHMNIHTLSAHWENLRELMCEIQGATFSFDVLGEVF